MRATARLAPLLVPLALLAADPARALPPETGAPPAATRRVALRVEDNRPPLEGGTNPELLGYTRSLVGLKAKVKAPSPDAVAKLVRVTVEDGLRQAGISVDANAPTTLTAQVLAYWVDWSGYAAFSGVGYTGTVAVEYTLTDASGRVLWRNLAVAERRSKGGAGTMLLALPRIAQRSARLFRSPGLPALD